MTYLLADRVHVICPDTFKFIGINTVPERDFDVDVPFYMWKHKDNVRQCVLIGSSCKRAYQRRVTSIELNGFTINFDGYESAQVMLPDKVIAMLAVAQTYEANSDGFKYTEGFVERLMGYYFRMVIDGIKVVKSLQNLSERVEGKPRYAAIPNLVKPKPNNLAVNTLNYGIRSTKYNLVYREQNLEPKYALLCGAWAILLSDALEFDSVVSLYTVSKEVLGIETIFYSVNPLMWKAKMLLR